MKGFNGFQINKIRRLIKTQGELFLFQNRSADSFGEPSGDTTIILVRGVFHETTSYLSRTSAESTTVRTKPSPMILCLWEDAKNLPISCELLYNGKRYKIGDIKNVSEMNIAADISLEEVQAHGRFSSGHNQSC